MLHPSQPGFTRARPDGTIASRIDLIGCPYAWLLFVASCEIFSCPYSDHAAVSLSWSSDSPSRGPGLWKLNCSVLDESDYFQLISDFWASWRLRRPSFSSLPHWWDRGKSRIKGLTINYCKDRRLSQIQERCLLSRLPEHLKVKTDSDTVSLFSVYHTVLSRLKALDLTEAPGAQVRSRIKWVEEGETSSSYFFRLEKKDSADRFISGLRTDDGSPVTGREDLCAAFGAFYADLFSASSVDAEAQVELLSHF